MEFVTKLAPRHLEVAGHIKSGLTNREIARRMGLSVHTVNGYVREALLLTGARNRAQLAVMVKDGSNQD